VERHDPADLSLLEKFQPPHTTLQMGIKGFIASMSTFNSALRYEDVQGS
jgi:hypothetical protein